VKELGIALVTPEYPGCGPSFGIGAYVRTLAQALHMAGAKPTVLVCGSAGRFSIEDDIVHQCGSSAASGLLRPVVHAGWLSREIETRGCQIVEYPNWAGLGAWLGGKAIRIARLSTPISLIEASSPGAALLRPLHHWAELRSIQRAHRVIANSAAMAASSQTIYGRSCDAIIPHAYAGPIVDQPSTGRDIITVGRLEARKGTDVLLDAWSRIRTRHPDTRLHLVGMDPTGFGATQLRRFGSAQVVVHGHVDERSLGEIRALCCLEVVASRFESFGLVVLEAWANGLAVVAANSGALGEIIGGIGDLVAAEDPQALADAIQHLLTRPERLAELARAGARILDQRYAPRAYAAATLAEYERALRAIAA
jgi:glycosyltransferase involved in cell wall biosynthesis